MTQSILISAIQGIIRGRRTYNGNHKRSKNGIPYQSNNGSGLFQDSTKMSLDNNLWITPK